MPPIATPAVHPDAQGWARGSGSGYGVRMLLRDSWLVWTAALCLVAACGSDEGGDGTTTLTTTDGTGSSTSSSDTVTETGDGSSTTQSDETAGDGDSGDGDGDTGDGDGDSGDGDGDSGDGDSGDGDGDSGDGDSGDGDGDTGDGDGDSGDGDGDGDSTTGDGDGDGDADCSDCAANTDLIYVLSDDAELWSFDPATNMFALVGALNCGTSTPFGTFSMSVSRAGIAWVMFQDNQLYQIDVNNPGSCVDSGFTPNSGFELFGMGFVSNSLTDPCEKLYMHDWSGFGGFSEGPNAGTMGAMEPSDLSVQLLGSIDYDGGELTGTGDGRVACDSDVLQKPPSPRSPQGKKRPSTPRAAFSHSDSVGSRSRTPSRRPRHSA